MMKQGGKQIHQHKPWALCALLLAALLLATAPALPSIRVARAADGNPFAGATWWVDPHSPVKAQAAAWRNSRPADATLLDYIAAQQYVDWYGDWYTNDQTEELARQRVAQVAAAGGVPIFAAYNLPDRDCGQFSQGGVADAAAYATWIDRLARGIGGGKAVVLLEPDALTVTFCFAGQPERLQSRHQMLKAAVARLKQNPQTWVYLEGGDEIRLSPADMAAALAQAGIAQADGFFLNTTVFQYTSSEVAYGRAIAALVGGKHFIVDTSRNGLGPEPDADTDPYHWCNAPGRALGVAPTTATGDPLVDAFLWIKPVWQSDGPCRPGSPAAGQPYWEYALELVRRARQPFTDLPSDAATAAQLRQLTRLGVLRGNGDGTVTPGATTQRAQMAALIARAAFWERDDWGATPFTDQGTIDEALWRDVGTLAHYGVAKGYGGGLYDPNGPVLYQQTILFISRFMVARGYWVRQADTPAFFPNLPADSPAAQQDRRDIATYVHYTQALGGVPDRPATGPFTAYDQPAPREWFVRALYRALASAGAVGSPPPTGP